MNQTLTHLISKELLRQQDSLELIASENYVSNAVISAYANVFTNKYSEWYPSKRYYGWNEIVDELELYTQDLALQLYSLDKKEWWVNVQPLSGSVANLAVYTWLLQAEDTILAMDLSAGWHLTHGMSLNASGKYFNIIHYGVDSNGYIDYDNLKALALEHKPKMIIAWFSAYPRNIERKQFVEIKQLLSKQWNAPLLMADIAHIAWLIAWWTLESPFVAGFDIVTTTTHKTLRWPRWALIYFKKQYEKEINRWVFPGVQWWPFDHVLVAKAQAFEEILDPHTKRSEYCHQIIKNTKTLSEKLLALWRTLSTWWTDNHMIILDVTITPLINGSVASTTSQTGKSAEKALEYIWLSTNKQLIANDPRTPLDPSGIRIGTPAITTRWLKEADMELLALIIHQCLTSQVDHNLLRKQVLQLCKKYPLWY